MEVEGLLRRHDSKGFMNRYSDLPSTIHNPVEQITISSHI